MFTPVIRVNIKEDLLNMHSVTGSYICIRGLHCLKGQSITENDFFSQIELYQKRKTFVFTKKL